MAEKMTLARPYSKAIFLVAKDSSLLEEWSNLLVFLALLVENELSKKLIHNPTISWEDKAGFIIEVCANKIQQLGKNLVRLLAQKDRLMLLPQIAQGFEQFKSQDQKQFDVIAEVARPLSEQDQSGLAKRLAQRLGGTVKIEAKEVPELLAGVRLKAGYHVIDGSFKGQLSALHAELLKN